MWRYFTYAKTQKYLDVLDELIESYNNTHHSSIGMAPSQVTSDNASEITDRLYPAKLEPIYKLDIGDKVRMAKEVIQRDGQIKFSP